MGVAKVTVMVVLLVVLLLVEQTNPFFLQEDRALTEETFRQGASLNDAIQVELITTSDVANNNFNVDLVITWVDSQNQEHSRIREQTWDNENRNHPGMFCDSGPPAANRYSRHPTSLKLFMETVFETAPWLRKVRAFAEL
eukprot:c11799_g1_i1.p2 GENE.c11799_g1_i1~~c11799_g1_i1.p2  ORF type:complete len:140 (+),score=38.64 c11799_g1_i1:94-513(+)